MILEHLIDAKLDAALDAVNRGLVDLMAVLAEAQCPWVAAIAAVECSGRLMDAARVRVLAPFLLDFGAPERLGYSSPIDAIASIAEISERSARTRLRVAEAVCDGRTRLGVPLEPTCPVVGSALDAGQLGLDAAHLVTTELDSVATRAETGALEVAEKLMVDLAKGVDPDGQLMPKTVSVDYLATEIRQITAAIDPDGARPREERAIRRRALRLGAMDEDGLIPLSGRLSAAIGLQLAGLFEAHRRSPRFIEDLGSEAGLGTEAGAPQTADDLAARASDPRTPDQRRHDWFGEIVMAAAAADAAPQLDGHNVTVIVTVAASDLEAADGLAGDPIGTMAGSAFPVSRGSVERYIDDGGYRTVTLGTNGRVAEISSIQRCFTPAQRAAIGARDGFRCATPGCTSRCYTLQAHHVIPDRHDGPTIVDNGILLCYWHHEQVDAGPWEYRMVEGMPFVRGPGIYEWMPLRFRGARTTRSLFGQAA